jgi:predicted O-linked N-acetylglucosamine transferase (SPINDLY family)
MAARLASSIVRAAGLPEMVVASHEEFEARAYQLASRQGELAAIRSRLQAAKGASALFDTAGRVGELERAYEMMWERYAAGLPPESFAVPRGGEPAHG